MYITFPVASAPNVQGVQRIIDGIKDATNGEVSVTLHLGGSLPIKGENITDAVADSVVQMGDDAFFQGNVPVAGLLRLPLLVGNYGDFQKAEAVMWPYIEEAYAAKGIVALGEYAYPLQYPFSRKELTSLADLTNQKIRPTSPEQGEFVSRFGGIAVTANAAEVTAALERGAFDGVITAAAVGGRQWKDFLKFGYAIPLNFGNSIIIVNRDDFAALPPEQQQKIRELVRTITQEITATLIEQNSLAVAELVSGGLTMTDPTPEDMARAEESMQTYWGEWAKQRGPVAEKALAEVLAALGQ